MTFFLRIFFAISFLTLLYSVDLSLEQVALGSCEQVKKPICHSSFCKFPAGVGNEVYAFRLEDGTQLVSKVFTKKMLSQVVEIENSVDVLREQGLSIPRTWAIAPLGDHFVLHISDFVGGSHIDDSDLLCVAQLMAKLHKIPTTLFPKIGRTFKTREHYLNLFEKCTSWHLASTLKQVYDDLDLSYLEEIPLGVIHGDFSYSNLLRSENERLSIIDFDHLSVSYLLTDLARCQMFYGFDKEGKVFLDKISSFVTAYHRHRHLSRAELEHFFDHMKLMMIDTALEMYYHMYVLHDLPFDIINHPENDMLLPDLLAKKILNLRGLREVRAIRKSFPKKPPVIFFGLSGVGKTSVINAMHENYEDETYIPKFTCTRAPREDDNPQYFEYVSQTEFDKLEKKGAFAYSTREKGRCYGYQWKHLVEEDKFPLMNCSVFGIKKAKAFGGITVLIKSETSDGINQRLVTSESRSRNEVNRIVQSQFLNQEWFQALVDVVEFNRLNSLDETARHLMSRVKQIDKERR